MRTIIKVGISQFSALENKASSFRANSCDHMHVHWSCRHAFARFSSIRALVSLSRQYIHKFRAAGALVRKIVEIVKTPKILKCVLLHFRAEMHESAPRLRLCTAHNTGEKTLAVDFFARRFFRARSAAQLLETSSYHACKVQTYSSHRVLNSWSSHVED